MSSVKKAGFSAFLGEIGGEGETGNHKGLPLRGDESAREEHSQIRRGKLLRFVCIDITCRTGEDGGQPQGLVSTKLIQPESFFCFSHSTFFDCFGEALPGGTLLLAVGGKVCLAAIQDECGLAVAQE